MDRPNASMAAAVNASLAMPNRREAVAYMIALRVPDHVIARILCERVDVTKRRSMTDSQGENGAVKNFHTMLYAGITATRETI